MAPADMAVLRDGSAAFAGRLLELLARTRPMVALSPFSISQGLALLSAGARGATAAQIATALDFRLPRARLHAAFNALDQALATVNGADVKLNVANALFGQRGERFRQRFLALLAREYGTGMRIVDFQQAPEAVPTAINQWVSNHTHGKIPTLLGPRDIDALTRLVLVNAVYLDAAWLLPFAKRATSAAPFHSPGGTVTVPTMHQTGNFAYLRGPDYQALELPYRGGRLLFDILLPDPGQLQSLLRRLGSGRPLDLLSGLRRQRVQLALPRLLLRTRFELAGPLSALGMPLAFLPGDADLSGIGGRQGELYVKAVVHEAYLRVDEAGTEAAAATGVLVSASSLAVAPAPIVFDVDRPFVFILRDIKTNAILFLGTIAQP